MKFIQKHSKIVAVITVMMLLFQSCSIYNFKSSTIDEAVESKKKARVLMNSGKLIKYKKIVKIEAQYFGIRGKDTIALAPKEIKRIKLQNTTASLVTSLVGCGAIIFLAAGIKNVDFSPEFSRPLSVPQ